MEKLNLKMEKLNFPGTDWRGLALIGAQKKPLIRQSKKAKAKKILETLWQSSNTEHPHYLNL